MDYLPELELILWCIAGYIWELDLKNTWIGLILCYIEPALRKIPKFHLIYWRANFEERHSFGIVLGASPKLCRNCAFPQNFHTRTLGEISVFYAVWGLKSTWITLLDSDWFYHTLAMDWLNYWKRDAVRKVWKFSWIINNKIAKV